MNTASPAAPQALKKRAVKGGLWASVGFGFGQLIRLSSNLVMARLLAPEAFGLMAIAIAIDFFLCMLSDLGIEGSIMRSKKGETSEFLATARLAQLGRNTLIAMFLVIIALALPAMVQSGWFTATSVYADERLPIFIYIVAAGMFLDGFQTMRVAVHNRKLDVLPVVRLEIVSQLCGVFATIGSALAGIGVFSLAIGMFVSHAAKVVGSFVLVKGLPAKFEFHRDHFDEIFSYGKWIIVASTFSFFVVRGDQVILGGLLDIRPFSLFAMATIWLMAARNLVEMVVRRVTYPVFSEVRRERPEELPRIFRQLRLAVEAGSIVIFFGILLCSDFAIKILYPEEFHDVSHYMKLLAVSVLFLPYRVHHNIILTAGQSRRYSYLTAIPGIILFIGTPIVFERFGADAAIIFATISPIFALPFNLNFAGSLVKLNYARECMMAVIACAASYYLLTYVHL